MELLTSTLVGIVEDGTGTPSLKSHVVDVETNFYMEAFDYVSEAYYISMLSLSLSDFYDYFSPRKFVEQEFLETLLPVQPALHCFKSDISKCSK